MIASAAIEEIERARGDSETFRPARRWPGTRRKDASRSAQLRPAASPASVLCAAGCAAAPTRARRASRCARSSQRTGRPYPRPTRGRGRRRGWRARACGRTASCCTSRSRSRWRRASGARCSSAAPPPSTGGSCTRASCSGTGGSAHREERRIRKLAALGVLAVGVDLRHHGERVADGTDEPVLARAQGGVAAAGGGGGRRIEPPHRGGGGGALYPFLYDSVYDCSRVLDYLETRADADCSARRRL